MNLKVIVVIAILILLIGTGAGAWYHLGQKDTENTDLPGPSEEGPVSDHNLILGDVTSNSIRANILSGKGSQAYIEYGEISGSYTDHTETVTSSGDSMTINLDGLSSGTHYFYRLRYKGPDNSTFDLGAERSFHTTRATDDAFTVVIEADPHLDDKTDPDFYNTTLDNMLADDPDLMFDLGDTFMTDKLTKKDRASVEARYLLMRQFFGRIAPSVPLYLATGNHDGEVGWENTGSDGGLAAMSKEFRTDYYPNPPSAGSSGNYYSLEWGNALFVVIDPYWFTEDKPGQKTADNWGWTLGKEQYDWFADTLKDSDAKFKFVFSHQIVGGAVKDGRGGTEFVPYYEMGGKNLDGSWGFDQERPGWGKPIHQIMVENDVSVYFHGHDHIFDKQDLDGIVYQECPQPGNRDAKASQAAEYGYTTGEILPGSGYMRVTISSDKATVDYIRTGTSSDTKEVAYSYTIE